MKKKTIDQKKKDAQVTDEKWEKFKKFADSYKPIAYLNDAKLRCDKYLSFLKLPTNENEKAAFYKSNAINIETFYDKKLKINRIKSASLKVIIIDKSDPKHVNIKKRRLRLEIECIRISREIESYISSIKSNIKEDFNLDDFEKIFTDVYNLGYVMRKFDEIFIKLNTFKGRPIVKAENKIKLKIEEITRSYCVGKNKAKINWKNVWNYVVHNHKELGLGFVPEDDKIIYLRQSIKAVTFARYSGSEIKRHN